MRTAVIIFLSLIITGCAFQYRNEAEPVAGVPTATLLPSPSPSSTPTILIQLTPMIGSPITGIEEIDRVVELGMAGDTENLRQLFVFTPVGCTHLQGLGGPPKCMADQTEGDLIEVVPVLGPEGHFFTPETLQDWPGLYSTDLYAIYRTSDGVYNDPSYPAGSYAIIFLGGEVPVHLALMIDRGGIVRIDYIFDETPDRKIQQEAAELLYLRPR